MALSTALKPQVGLVFVGYYAYRRQWRVALAAAGVLALVMFSPVVSSCS